ncbi:MAG: hypothetical protein IT281_00355 [Ignavibacteria bacterium]|nr:hypothetical protein [Ignavibacteria bacterium]MCC7157968.1 hypothetical protein [Ignavibacteria bacterium]
MENSINQRVINFTAEYVERDPDTINDLTTYESIGIVTNEELVQYMVELEDSFGLIYDPGDETGIIVVGNATEFITKKLG